MHILRKAFYDEGKKLDAKGDREANCWLCKEPIDYTATPSTTPSSHNLDHFFPVSTHPDAQEDPTNFRHAHMLCNQSRGKNAPSLGIGEAVADWW
ncbi:hypothetical protein [Cryobacterium psychrophilum]|uniref:HNH endonuclease n=1 Tax=Cryobacterium psychrophilum TaxID=41988 RepID=A0A4Y8KQ05_9MICO|nr:hypothetical protein [Cryobacterium psychrophilum]TFD80868.1 hypothetical protein E3T53_04390 [Cryobacterium psychrophilum]